MILQQRKKRKIYMPIQLIKRAFFFWGGGGCSILQGLFLFLCCCFVLGILVFFYLFQNFVLASGGQGGGGGCPSPTFVINGSKNKAINSEIEVTKSTCYRISMISIIDLFFFSYFFQIFWMRLPPPTLTKNNARCLVCPWFVSPMY